MSFKEFLEQNQDLEPLHYAWRSVRKLGHSSKAERVRVRAPIHWSDQAVEIAAHKYLRKTSLKGQSYERDLEAVFHRLALSFQRWGRRLGHFSSEREAKLFYRQLTLLLGHQLMAPNSPQWFNTGLYEAYGLKTSDDDRYAVDPKTHQVQRVRNGFARPNAHACFIQSVEDHLLGESSIMDLLVKEARVFKFGSGTGSNFSKLRAINEPLETGGVSSGVMAFLKVFDRSAGSIKSGGTTRRAAKMVILDDDHPEIIDFIRWKSQEEIKASALFSGQANLKLWEQRVEDVLAKKIELEELVAFGRSLFLPETFIEQTCHELKRGRRFRAPKLSSHYEGEIYNTLSGQNANHSVRLSKRFFAALKRDSTWTLKGRVKGQQKVKARELWEELCQAAWQSADPGVLIDENIQRWHTCSEDGEIRSCNPCGEYFFLDDTACNLASLNLLKFYREETQSFDLKLFRHAIALSIFMLDITVSMASYPSSEMAKRSHQYRTLGLGFSNLGGLLMKLGLPYDSPEARRLASGLSALMSGEAWRVSSLLAQQLGPFAAYKRNQKRVLRVLQMHQKALKKTVQQGENELEKEALKVWQEVLQLTSKHGVRNAQTTLVAPTGTISFVMDCLTTGIEPEFSLSKTKYLAGGGVLQGENPLLEELCRKWKLGPKVRERLISLVREKGSVQESPDLNQEQKDVLACAREIGPEGHLKMMAAVQPFVCGGISKTINLGAQTSPEEIGALFMMARDLGLKSVAVYREGSKLSEPLVANQHLSGWKCPSCGAQRSLLIGRCFVCQNCGETTACA